MQPTDDSALLRQYVENHSDEAFAGLVTRHINLVYSVALRQVGNPHAAEEVTQAVFIILAKKAAQLRHDKALSSWLFQATRLTASNFVRSESRRHHREKEAYMQTVLEEAGSEVWPRIAPLLDNAVAGLREKDRQAIVLRFYEGRNLREVGLALGASEDAAEKRVNRTLEKLRRYFSKRGVSSTTGIIAGAISANSVQAAPAALAKSVTTVAVANGAAASISTLTLTKITLIAMKTKTIIATTIATVVILGAGVYLAGHSKPADNSSNTHITLPIRLANGTSHRDANDPLFEIGVDPDTQRTSNSAPAIYIKGPTRPASDVAERSSDAALQKAGNSCSIEYYVAKGSPLLGKRIRITGWLKSSNVQDWAAAYMCIWSKNQGFCRVDTMDNRDDRPILHGTMDWQQVEFITDVPNKPCFIYVGPDLYGPGELWGDDFQIDFAAPDMPITDDRIWRHTSDTPDTYSETTDYLNTHDGHSTVCLAYISSAESRGAWMWWGQKIRAPDFDKYKGHSMRMSGWVKTENVSGRLQPCVRPWDKNGKWGKDSMTGDFSLKGTLDWTHFSVTGVIPKDTRHIDTPFIFWGSGKVWIDMDSLKFEVIK